MIATASLMLVRRTLPKAFHAAKVSHLVSSYCLRRSA